MKNHRKWIINKISLLTAIIMITVCCPVINTSAANVLFNETFDDGQLPDVFTYSEAGGSISVTETASGKCLFLKNENEGAYTMIKSPIEAALGANYDFGFDYMQKDVQNGQNVIFELNSESYSVLKIYTKDNEIVYETNDNPITLVSPYYANKWYSFDISLSIPDKKAEVLVSGCEKAENLPLLRDAFTIDEMRSYTAYAPGFLLDNMFASYYQTRDIANVKISGKNNIIIPQTDVYEYEYVAHAYDTDGNVIKNDEFCFNIYEEISENNYQIVSTLPAGVSTDIKKNKFIIKVENGADIASGTKWRIEAYLSDAPEVKAKADIELSLPYVSAAKIKGPDRVAYLKDKETVFKYECELLDINGNGVTGGNYDWSLLNTGLPDGIEFDTANATITISSPQKNGTLIKIKAVSSEDSNVFAEKTIAVLDLYTYRTDEQRMAKVKQYVDKVLVKAADKYNGTPLLANGLDVDTDEHVSIDIIKDEYHPYDNFIPSDLAQQFNFYRTLYALSDITGNEYYKDRAKSIYKYYIDSKLYSDNGLLYVGGHCNIDLRTGKVCYATKYPDIHEYKDHFGFYEPFYEIDPGFAENYLKNTFAGHFYDMEKLFFNRHAHFTKVMNAEKIFSDLNAYDESDLSIIVDCEGLTFRSAGNDMIYVLADLYEHTGDIRAITWARRILDRYIALQNPVTNIGVQLYNTGYGDPKCRIAPDGWWKLSNYMDYTVSNYGDRLNVQFADQWIKEGLYPESRRGDIIEAYYILSPEVAYGTANIIDLKMADVLGTDTADGLHYATNTLKTMAGYIKYAYIPEKNCFNSIMSDGTVLTGYQVKRNGYYGKKGTVFGTLPVTNVFFCSAVEVFGKIYSMPDVREDYNEELKVLWEFISNYVKANKMGDFKDYFSDDIEVNLGTGSSDPYAVMAFVSLYRNTGNYNVLNLARAIGNNIIEENMVNGYFVANKESKYCQLDEFYAYALVLLDAATRNDFTTVPKSYLGKGFLHTGYKDARGRDMAAAFDYNFLWNRTRDTVYVKKIITDKNHYSLKAGEKLPAEVTIFPDDASTAEINWYSEDPSVAVIDDEHIIYAYSAGSTKITGVSNDLKAKVEFYVEVEE